MEHCQYQKSHNLTFSRNVRTILLSFERKRVLIIVIRRTFTAPNSPFFKGSFFSPPLLDIFPFLSSYVFFFFFYITIINFLYIPSYFICFSIFYFSHFFLPYFYFFFVKQFLIEPAVFLYIFFPLCCFSILFYLLKFLYLYLVYHFSISY